MEDLNSNDVSFKDVFIAFEKIKNYLKSRWLFIVAVSLLGGGLGLAYAIVKKPVYVAQLSFALEDPKAGNVVGSYGGLASQIGLDFGGGSNSGAFAGDNLMELMKSRAMVEKTLLTNVDIAGKNETLAELYIDFNNIRSVLLNDPKTKNVNFSAEQDRAKFTLQQDSLLGTFYKGLISKNLTVERMDKKLGIIIVTVTSKNQLFSKYFAQVLVDKVSKFYIETKTKKSSQNVKILQHQTDSVRTKLGSSIGGVASSIDLVPNANPNRVSLKVSAQNHQVDVQINNVILAELVKNLEVAKVSLRNETPLIQIIDAPILPLDRVVVNKVFALLVGVLLAAFLTMGYLTVRKIIVHQLK